MIPIVKPEPKRQRIFGFTIPEELRDKPIPSIINEAMKYAPKSEYFIITSFAHVPQYIDPNRFPRVFIFCFEHNPQPSSHTIYTKKGEILNV